MEAETSTATVTTPETGEPQAPVNEEVVPDSQEPSVTPTSPLAGAALPPPTQTRGKRRTSDSPDQDGSKKPNTRTPENENSPYLRNFVNALAKDGPERTRVVETGMDGATFNRCRGLYALSKYGPHPPKNTKILKNFTQGEIQQWISSGHLIPQDAFQAVLLLMKVMERTKPDLFTGLED